MPPAIHDDEVQDDLSDGVEDEIPPKKPQPKKAAAKPKAKSQEDVDAPMPDVENGDDDQVNGNGNDDDDDDDDDDEDDDDEVEEYVVETIVSHDFEKDGTCKYEVKWLGYEAKSDRTWEPEENLGGAMEVLRQYWDKIGGKPEFKPKTPAGKGRKGKRKSVPAESTPDVDASAKRGKRSKRNSSQEKDSGIKLPEGSWEDEVQYIDSIEQGAAEEGRKTVQAFLIWNDNRKTRHSTTLVRQKCPLKLIDYYESKLVFKDGEVQQTDDVE